MGLDNCFKFLMNTFNGRNLDLLCLMLGVFSQNSECNLRQETTALNKGKCYVSLLI